VNPLIDAVIWYAAFLLSLTLHEAAHGWAALRGGDPTAYHGGQVTLDPRPHIRREPIGTVVVPIISYALSGFPIGWASAPYDPRWAFAHPKRAAWMALAGPAGNLLLVLVAALLIRVGLAAGVFVPPAQIGFASLVAAPSMLWATLGDFLGVVFFLNLLLCVFNLMPVPPLDGATALGIFLHEQTARRIQIAMNQSPFGILGLLIAWMLIGRIFWPVFWASVDVLYLGLASYG